jgi:hypothetical protein
MPKSLQEQKQWRKYISKIGTLLQVIIKSYYSSEFGSGYGSGSRVLMTKTEEKKAEKIFFSFFSKINYP